MKKTKIQTLIKMEKYFTEMKETCEKMLALTERELIKEHRKKKNVNKI